MGREGFGVAGEVIFYYIMTCKCGRRFKRWANEPDRYSADTTRYYLGACCGGNVERK